jgi:hypothetical protein
MANPENVEAYVNTRDTAAILNVLSTRIGRLSFHSRIDDDWERYAHDAVTVDIKKGMQHGFTSVQTVGSHEWRNDVDLARFLSAKLMCTALCDPGSEFPEVDPYSDIFLEVSNDVERLIEWTE